MARAGHDVVDNFSERKIRALMIASHFPRKESTIRTSEHGQRASHDAHRYNRLFMKSGKVRDKNIAPSAEFSFGNVVHIASPTS
jgi:hypothetical protein